ncbi:guanylate kinase [Candidatus Uhrbacteria bacterium]|nr:guanylate kinase [Candidatus Uhrbacteria bacterium]
MKGHLFVITGPSGAGKSSIAEALLAKHTLDLKRVVTCTTRTPRPGELNDVDYHFLTHEEFERLIATDALLEWAQVYGNYYGSRKQDVQEMLDRGETVLIVLDVQGAARLHNIFPEAKIIFITADSSDILRDRIIRRNPKLNDVDDRQAVLQKELAFIDKSDFIVTNHEDRLEEATKEVEGIVLS